MKRQIPRPHDLRPLMQFKRPTVNPARRRLDAALTVRHRPHWLHPHDANRRRACRSRCRSRRRDPLRPVHHGNHLNRGCRRRSTQRPQLVPAIHMERPGPLHGPGRPRRQGWLRHPARHCRRSGRRSAGYETSGTASPSSWTNLLRAMSRCQDADAAASDGGPGCATGCPSRRRMALGGGSVDSSFPATGPEDR
jgi:hypothetical protein